MKPKSKSQLRRIAIQVRDARSIHRYSEDRFGVFTLLNDPMSDRQIMRHTYHDGTWLEKPIWNIVLDMAADPDEVYRKAIKVLTGHAEIRFENKRHLVWDYDIDGFKWAGGGDE